MRLKQLEIKGFKSFANETVINFQDDVIGIVGPNGSGKSNVVDAIRWVLGEQKSKELRLDQMSSVIFNGTKRRKPSGIASVSLTFENTRNLLPTEYTSVTITRMLYRTGESEYRLNGVPCRLKDITTLFMDTGIGSNSYAIIALGMVDDILADKDDSRRRMFEQAAGVSKYKMRKRETLAKLKSTTEDLERVEDLLFEINNNLNSLEKQAKRAKKYFELKAEYKELSIQLAALRVDELRKRYKSEQQTLQQEESRYRQLGIEIDQLEAVLAKDRKENLDKEKVLSDSQRELNQLIGRIRGRENDKQMLVQKEQFITQNRKNLERNIAEAGSRLSLLQEQIEQFRTDLNAEKRVEARLELELNQAEDQLDKVRSSHAGIKNQLDASLQTLQAAEKQVFELEKQRAINQNQVDNQQQQRDRLLLDIDNRKKEIEDFTHQLASLTDQETQQAEEVRRLERNEEQRQEDVARAETDIEQLNRQLARINRELDAKRNEYKLTKSMIESLEGFPESIRFLSQHKDWKANASLLSDLIYVQEDYRLAIENYLEPYLNYYVVKNLEEAQQAIQLLGKTQKGKANFFLLDAFAEDQPALSMLPPTARAAVDLVEVEPAYRPLVARLLENVLVVDHDDLLTEAPADNWTLISKSGRFIRRKFSVSGGSVGLFEGKKIGRKKNLALLEVAIKKLEQEEQQQMATYYQSKSYLDQLRNVKSQPLIQQANQRLNQLAQQKVSLSTRLDSFTAFVEEVRQKDANLIASIETILQQNQQIDHQLQDKQLALSQLKASLQSTDQGMRQVADQLSLFSAAFNEKNIAFIRQQNKVNTLQQELSFREKQLQELTTARKSNEQTLAQSQRELDLLLDDRENIERELREAYAARKEKETGLSTVEQAYFQSRESIHEKEDKLRKTSRQQQELQVAINQLRDKFNDVKFELSSLAQRLRIEFGINANDLLNDPLPVSATDPVQLAAKVERIKERIDNYGEINPMAVEAYDEMKNRYDTITQQRDDILAAKESLSQTIKEIEDTATAQFLEAFDRARLYFIEVFRSLFTEDDNCDLILLNPEDPLESRIEIVAKPKGKRPQTISQLSGGEKTLTATALLFALYLLKPAPFCIFDEVDAPLDDANIYKFNRIIKKFSKESQFIIVTHNKLTMSSVDTIYGVHMPEQGVSAVTPVDFRQFELSGSFESVNN